MAFVIPQAIGGPFGLRPSRPRTHVASVLVDEQCHKHGLEAALCQCGPARFVAKGKSGGFCKMGGGNVGHSIAIWEPRHACCLGGLVCFERSGVHSRVFRSVDSAPASFVGVEDAQCRHVVVAYVDRPQWVFVFAQRCRMVGRCNWEMVHVSSGWEWEKRGGGGEPYGKRTKGTKGTRGIGGRGRNRGRKRTGKHVETIARATGKHQWHQQWMFPLCQAHG